MSRRKKRASLHKVAIGLHAIATQIPIATRHIAILPTFPTSFAAFVCTTSALKSRAIPCASTWPCPQNKTARCLTVIITRSTRFTLQSASDHHQLASVIRLSTANKLAETVQPRATYRSTPMQQVVMDKQWVLKPLLGSLGREIARRTVFAQFQSRLWMRALTFHLMRDFGT